MDHMTIELGQTKYELKQAMQTMSDEKHAINSVAAMLQSIRKSSPDNSFSVDELHGTVTDALSEEPSQLVPIVLMELRRSEQMQVR